MGTQLTRETIDGRRVSLRSLEWDGSLPLGRLRYTLPQSLPRDSVRRLKTKMWGIALQGTTSISAAAVCDFAELIVREFGGRVFTIEEVADFTLYETIYRDDAHLKGPVLGAMEGAGLLKVIASDRRVDRPGSYPPDTLLALPAA
jgi:hypothetical protein